MYTQLKDSHISQTDIYANISTFIDLKIKTIIIKRDITLTSVEMHCLDFLEQINK